MKRIFIAAPFAVLLFLAPECRLLAGATNAPGEIVARTKDFEVRRGKLDEAWAIYEARVSRAGQLPDEPRDSVERKLLDHIVQTEILLRKATPDEKRQALEATEKLMSDSRKRFGSDDDFNDWLKMMGMTPEIYRSRMIEQHTCETVIDREIGPSITITDEQVQAYYDENAPVFDRPEQVRGRQIYFATIDPATQQPLSQEQQEEKKRLANKVKARLDKGEDFLALYKEFSEEPWAKDESAGDEMLYVKGQMPPEFDAAAFALKTNEISGVITTPLGFHIIRISEHQPASRLPLATVAPRLKAFLLDEEIKKRMPAYLEKIMKEAGAEILPREPSVTVVPK